MKRQKIFVYWALCALVALSACSKAPEKSSSPSSNNNGNNNNGTTNTGSCSLLKVTDGDGSVNYTYKSGLLTYAAQDLSNHDNLYANFYYDSKNKLIAIKHFYDGCPMDDSLTIDYNTDQTISKVHIYSTDKCRAAFENEEYDFTYNGNKKLAKIVYNIRYSGSQSFHLYEYNEYTWDSKNKNITQVDRYDSTGAKNTLTLTYDTKNNIYAGMLFSDPNAVEDEDFDELALNENNPLTITSTTGESAHITYQYNSNNYPSSLTSDSQDLGSAQFQYNCK